MHLFDKFKSWTFKKAPYERLNKDDKSIILSYSYNTFSHTAFIPLFDLFWQSGKKAISSGLIKNHLTLNGFAYWIADDGYYHKVKKYLIIHTQSFSKEENEILSMELNAKFNLNSTLLKHQKKEKVYWVLYFPPKDVLVLQTLLTMPLSMEHKLGLSPKKALLLE